MCTSQSLNRQMGSSSLAHPSMNTPCSSISLYSVLWILVLIATASSSVCVPVIETSGSTMGTSPTSCATRRWQSEPRSRLCPDVPAGMD